MSEAAGIKVGDVVTLKSGGPRMTVVGVPERVMGFGDVKVANCAWFNGGEDKVGYWPLDALTVESDAPSDPVPGQVYLKDGFATAP